MKKMLNHNVWILFPVKTISTGKKQFCNLPVETWNEINMKFSPSIWFCGRDYMLIFTNRIEDWREDQLFILERACKTFLYKDSLHRITEKWSWKGPTRPSSPTPCSMQEYNQSTSARWLSKFFLNASSVGAFNNSWGKWFHCHTTLTVRRFFLIFNQNLASIN